MSRGRFVSLDLDRLPSVSKQVDHFDYYSHTEFMDSVVIPYLPPEDKDLYDMRFKKTLPLQSISDIFSVRPSDVSYRITRLKEKIQYILPLAATNPYELVSLLDNYLPSDAYLTTIVSLLVTTSQSETARQLTMSQGRVRSIFQKSIPILVESAFPNMNLLANLEQRWGILGRILHRSDICDTPLYKEGLIPYLSRRDNK